MAPVQDISEDQVTTMLRTAAEACGMSYLDFVAAGTAGTLTDPTLRDLWLIWGPEKPKD